METEAGGGAGRRRRGAWTGAIAIGVAVAALTAWSWRGWTDPQVDFGNEFYIAWQLSEGQTLYQDIAHRNGPLSHYWNALWFRILGVSLRTLVWVNLAILTAICALVFAVFRRACGDATACVCVLVMLGVFAFGQYTPAANYNYVTPYHHFQTHGLALGLGMMLALLRLLERRGAGAALAAGVCLGGVLLTKAELAVPALVTAAAGWTLVLAAGGGRSAALGAIFLAGLLAPLALGLAGLADRMPLPQAFQGLLGNWSHLGADLASDRFYRVGAGFDDVPGHLLRAFASFAALSVVAGALLALDRWLSGLGTPGILVTGAALAGGVALAILPSPRLWFSVARGLPVLSLAAAIGFALACARGVRRPETLRRHVPWLLWSIYSLLLLAKMLLDARFHQYGFVLAMPATLLLVALLIDGLPGLAHRRWGGGSVVRSISLALVAAAVFGFLRVSNARYQAKQLELGRGPDAIRVDAPGVSPRGALLARTLRRLQALAPPGTTLLVYPEGSGLNYWLRRANPSRFTLFLPTELEAFGRETVRDDVIAARPDLVVLVHRDHGEFGVGPFGVDPRNGRDLLEWVHENYELVQRLGAPPFRSRAFGVEIWRRHDWSGESAR